jgi:hypothetical protein
MVFELVFDALRIDHPKLQPDFLRAIMQADLRYSGIVSRLILETYRIICAHDQLITRADYLSAIKRLYGDYVLRFRGRELHGHANNLVRQQAHAIA